MKQLNFKVYSDPQHAWVAVKRQLLIDLGIESVITSFSYQSASGGTVYLEEDQDATTLVNALKSRGVLYSFAESSYQERSRIRSLPRFKSLTKVVSQ